MSAGSARTPISALEIAERLGRPAPTPEQVAVIEAPLEPALVVAGAGSGKTETMAARVVWLVANGYVAPHQVLGLTFTNKAAHELAERIIRRVRALRRAVGGVSDPLDVLDRPLVSTYNSYAANLVSEHGLRVGVEPTSRILTEAGRWQLASQIVESWGSDLGTDKAVSTVTTAVMRLAGELSEHLLSPKIAAEQIAADIATIEALPSGKARGNGTPAPVRDLLGSLRVRQQLMLLVEAFIAAKNDRDLVDFGDQVFFAERLAREAPAVSSSERDRFRVVLLDEYQDTSYAQIQLLSTLFGDGHPVTAVGDPHQSIYGWRGASAAGLRRFPHQFATPQGQLARILTLSTSWRNDRHVLEAANVLAEPLRRAEGGAPVTVLATRPAAGAGTVQEEWAQTAVDEAEQVARFVASRWRPSWQGDPVTAAVLCRTRATMPLIETALHRRGVPVEVVGVGGLLSTPEVSDLLAFLQVTHDPSRGDALVRLLTGPAMNIGAADLAHLAAWGAARDAHEAGGGRSSEPRSLADVVDEIGTLDAVSASEVTGLSREGSVRIRRFARMVREARAVTYLPIADLVERCEKILDLDIEVPLARRQGDPRANLDAFRAVAGQFAHGGEIVTLGAFLAWLDAAQHQERGLDMPASEPNPDAVQLLTIHGAKGLEWDVVAVPGLVETVFPSVGGSQAQPKSSAWLTGIDTLPYHLRGDGADLPALEFTESATQQELSQQMTDLQYRAGEHQVLEERRLAYVAVTRARHQVLLSGSWWAPTKKRPTAPSIFLTELDDAGALSWERRGADDSHDSAGFDDAPHHVNNPLAAERSLGWWPESRDAGSASEAARREDDTDGDDSNGVDPLQQAADLVRSAQSSPLGQMHPAAASDGDTLALADEDSELVAAQSLAAALLRERADRVAEPRRRRAPGHLAATALVRLAADSEAFLNDLRRPIPQPPSDASTLGTRFHEWVQSYYTRPSLLDVDSLEGASPRPDARLGGGDSPVDDDLGVLREHFLASPWARRSPIAVEQEIEETIAGTATRLKIDAVFEDPDVVGGVIVVDWKTGRIPGPHERAARDVQLAVYRTAWARATEIPPSRVRAVYFYVREGRTIEPATLLNEDQLEELVLSSFASASPSSSATSAPGASAPGSSEGPEASSPPASGDAVSPSDRES